MNQEYLEEVIINALQELATQDIEAVLQIAAGVLAAVADAISSNQPLKVLLDTHTIEVHRP